MYFPLSVKDVVRDPFDPAGRIDREISDRGRRLAVGTCLSDDLQSVCSALVVATGKGKYLRILSAVTTSHELPEFTVELLRHVVDGPGLPCIQSWLTLQADIAMVQAAAIEELKSSAGKYVDRLLFIAVPQPDRIIEKLLTSVPTELEFTDTQLLADQTGLSVISAFGKRDILAGGSGLNLDALPAWILFADRSHRIACRNRILFCIGDTARAFFLPASDGMDSDLPGVRLAATTGLQRFAVLADTSWDQISQLNLEGVELDTNDVDELQRCLESGAISPADYVRSSVVSIVQEISQRITSRVPRSTAIHEIVVDTPPQILGMFANQFRRQWPDADVFDGFGWDSCGSHLQPILAATLGILSVDQLPANIPWITGAHCQRILGSLTPGSPANWRQLLRDMADFQPPVMRLRDAV